MAEEIDMGDIIRQSPLEIRDDDTLHSLNERVALKGADVLLSALQDIRTESVSATPMDPDEGNYYSMPTCKNVRTFLERGNEFF
jgi:methionyl-tRNA formyltransferase